MELTSQQHLYEGGNRNLYKKGRYVYEEVALSGILVSQRILCCADSINLYIPVFTCAIIQHFKLRVVAVVVPNQLVV